MSYSHHSRRRVCENTRCKMNVPLHTTRLVSLTNRQIRIPKAMNSGQPDSRGQLLALGVARDVVRVILEFVVILHGKIGFGLFLYAHHSLSENTEARYLHPVNEVHCPSELQALSFAYAKH